MLLTRGNKITWLGHSTFQIATPSGKVILIDPWVMGNPACPAGLKKLARVDVMLITHGHSDHFADAMALARAHKPEIVAIYETCLWLESKGIPNTLPMSKGGTQKVGEIEVTMVHAIHSNSVQDEGKIVYAGEPCGYIVRLPGGLKLYHAGDTAVFGDMKMIGELHVPELACLPIGDLYTMGPREAALAIRLLDVRHVVPMHYGTFPALTGTPAALGELTQDIAGLEIHALQPGETLG
ncbi:MAG TPA: metal-dependent hydrolase [Candidatus Acidoferrales bacterium]|nr:metal-dependent hydrolase [Candidatus Acidoferrales bacterium]